MKRPANQRKTITLTAPVGRWNRTTGDLDPNPRTSDFKLTHPLVLN